MRIYLATDHAGFALKEEAKAFLLKHNYTVEDCGSSYFMPGDDYIDYVAKAAKSVSESPDNRCAIVFGGSGQGEAMAANKFPRVRATVYYGEPVVKNSFWSGFLEIRIENSLDIIKLGREHNNSNVLSIGARFIDKKQAIKVIEKWLNTKFSGEVRHVRRNAKLDNLINK